MMMKKILMAAVTLAAIASVPSTASAADFTVSATVAPVCSYSGGSIAFPTLTVQSDGTLSANQSSSSTGQTGFYCNGAGTTVALSHVAMTTSASAPGFVNSINFTPVVTVGGTDLVTGDKTAGTSFGAQSGSLVVTAKNLTAGGKVIAGDYNGSITLTLSPAV